MDDQLTRASGLALIADAQRWQRAYEQARNDLAAAEEALSRPARDWFNESRKAEAALREIQRKQVEALERFRQDGIVFDEKPHHDPKNWQQVAFWLYTDLCEAESIARAALGSERDPQFDHDYRMGTTPDE